MKRAFLDSVYWIAIKHTRDKWHETAITLREYVLSLDTIFINEGILVETGNFLLRKVGAGIAHDVISDLLNSDKINLVENTEISRRGSIKIMINHKHLSYTDANIIWHMLHHKIDELVSFDAGFDGIKNIKRIY